MTTRLETMRYLIDKHHAAYAAHLTDVLLGIEATSISRLNLWERTVREHPALLESQPDSRAFMASPTYGDGGMAAAVGLRSMAYGQAAYDGAARGNGRRIVPSCDARDLRSATSSCYGNR